MNCARLSAKSCANPENVEKIWKLRLGMDARLGHGLTPQAINAARQLRQVCSPQPPDGLLPIQLEPIDGATDGLRAAAQLLDRVTQDIDQRDVWMQMLSAGE